MEENSSLHIIGDMRFPSDTDKMCGPVHVKATLSPHSTFEMTEVFYSMNLVSGPCSGSLLLTPGGIWVRVTSMSYPPSQGSDPTLPLNAGAGRWWNTSGSLQTRSSRRLTICHNERRVKPALRGFLFTRSFMRYEGAKWLLGKMLRGRNRHPNHQAVDSHHNSTAWINSCLSYLHFHFSKFTFSSLFKND